MRIPRDLSFNLSFFGVLNCVSEKSFIHDPNLNLNYNFSQLAGKYVNMWISLPNKKCLHSWQGYLNAKNVEKHSFDIIEYSKATDIEGQISCYSHPRFQWFGSFERARTVFHKPLLLWHFVTCSTNETFFVACIEDLEHCEAEVEITYLSSGWS